VLTFKLERRFWSLFWPLCVTFGSRCLGHRGAASPFSSVAPRWPLLTQK